MLSPISFCTTCRNRLWQLRETLPKNLDSLDGRQEIVLVDYGSTDGLSDWIWINFKSYIDAKKLVFFEVKNEVRWNVARAKNLAHRLASGNYLFNLDADNFIHPQDFIWIEKAIEMGLHCHQWSGKWGDGSFGRIGISRELFLKIGGYDETLLPMGAQDVDILHRLVALKHSRARLPAPQLAAIQNTERDKIKELVSGEAESKDVDNIYEYSNSIGLQISALKLRTEGAIRLGGGFSYKGLLNGRRVTINGFDEIRHDAEESR
jgi:glycosyltransferase involved in cell wall biosynthesis